MSAKYTLAALRRQAGFRGPVGIGDIHVNDDDNR